MSESSEYSDMWAGWAFELQILTKSSFLHIFILLHLVQEIFLLFVIYYEDRLFAVPIQQFK